MYFVHNFAYSHLGVLAADTLDIIVLLFMQKIHCV